MAPVSDLDAIDAVCAFERFYEKRLRDFYKAALVQESSWAEINVLLLLGRYTSGGASADCVRDRLKIDSGYLSRVLKGLVAQGVVSRSCDPDDRRSTLFELTERGRRQSAALRDFHHLIEAYEPRRMRIATRRLRQVTPRPSPPRPPG